MAYSQSDLDALKAAIASGLLSYEHNGTRTVYRDHKSMIAALELMQTELSPSTTLPGRTVGVYNSGLRGSFLLPSRGCR